MKGAPELLRVERLGSILMTHASVLCAASSSLFALRASLAVADHIDLVERHLVRFIQVALHGLGALRPRRSLVPLSPTLSVCPSIST